MASPAPWPPRDGSRRPSHLRTRACAGKGAIFSAFFFVGARRFSCAPGPERLVEKVTPRHHRPRLPTASGVRTVMWSSSPFHTRGGAPACWTPPPTTRTATATATTTTTNRRCNARLTSVPGLRSVVPHIDEMLHQFCRALSAILRCSSPLPPILILGAWRRSLGAPPQGSRQNVAPPSRFDEPGAAANINTGGRGGGKRTAIATSACFLDDTRWCNILSMCRLGLCRFDVSILRPTPGRHLGLDSRGVYIGELGIHEIRHAGYRTVACLH